MPQITCHTTHTSIGCTRFCTSSPEEAFLKKQLRKITLQSSIFAPLMPGFSRRGIMLLYSAALLIGFVVLFKSADFFVVGSVATARNLNVSALLIGLTIVALGTSAPEIFVAMASSLQGEPELAVGNAIGSNIANIGMVLGITALLIPLEFRKDVVRNDLPVLVFVTLCAGAALIDHKLSWFDGVLLLFGLGIFLFRLVREHRQTTDAEIIEEIPELKEILPMSTRKAVLVLGLSLCFLVISAEVLVWAVIGIATQIGISELIIGLTVVAIGTSLPELVVSVTSALKQQTDLAIGNIIGSNIFNILAVLSIPSLLAPAELSPVLLWRDYSLMFVFTGLLVLFSVLSRASPILRHWQGGLLLGAWVIYLVSLYTMELT
tara:strand:- start:1012 stop:2142 length:1131 start_codon:yes stop_codon:yes gene_type:complete